MPAAYSFLTVLTRNCSWERGRILDNEAVSWLWGFCETKHNQLKVRAEALQRVACETIRQGFLEYGIDSSELFEEGHVFSRHFRAGKASQNSAVGLRALIAAADQVQANTPGIAGETLQGHSVGEMPSQQQLPEPPLDTTATNQQFRQQSMLHQYHPTTEMGWPGGTVRQTAHPRHSSDPNIPNHSTDEFAVARGPDSEFTPSLTAYGETVPESQFNGGMHGMYQGMVTSGYGAGADDEWNDMVADLYMRIGFGEGDGTSYTG